MLSSCASLPFGRLQVTLVGFVSANGGFGIWTWNTSKKSILLPSPAYPTLPGQPSAAVSFTTSRHITESA